MKIRIFTFLVILLFSSSCNKDKTHDFDYFMFGTAYGFCQGNCTNLFMIKDGAIYPDDMDYYTDSSLKFKSEAMEVEKYNLAKNLIDEFPDYLIENPNKTFGCPDCADQGGIHIEIKENGRVSKWHLDTSISNLPIEIQEYAQKLMNVIEELKQD